MTFSNTGKAVRGAYVPVNPKGEDGDGIVILDGALIELISQSLSGLIPTILGSLTRFWKSAKNPSQIRSKEIRLGLNGTVAGDENVPVNRFSLATRILVGGFTVAVYGGSNSMCSESVNVLVVILSGAV